MAAVTAVPELSTGRRPQNAVLCRGVARPDLIFVDDPAAAGDVEKGYNIPEHVPVFTTEAAMEAFMSPVAGAKRSRDDGDANLIPVIAHMGVDGGNDIDDTKFKKKGGAGGEKLIFVGISYGEASRSRPTVSIATGGLMPMVQNPIQGKALKVGKPAWWNKEAITYGRGMGAISIAVLANDGANISNEIEKSQDRAFCGVAVQQSTQDDIAVLLGVPPQLTPTP